MPKDTKTLCIKKGCASVLTQPLSTINILLLFSLSTLFKKTMYLNTNILIPLRKISQRYENTLRI